MEKYRKIAMYCRVGHDENQELKKEDKPFTDISKYKPYKGFYDLRDFDLSNEIFKKLWKIQDYLFKSNNNKDYLKKRDPVQWNNLKKLSGEYQRILLRHKLKKQDKVKENVEIEIER